MIVELAVTACWNTMPPTFVFRRVYFNIKPSHSQWTIGSQYIFAIPFVKRERRPYCVKVAAEQRLPHAPPFHVPQKGGSRGRPPVWYDNLSGVEIRPAPLTFITGTECHITYLRSYDGKNHSVSGSWMDENILV